MKTCEVRKKTPTQNLTGLTNKYYKIQAEQRRKVLKFSCYDCPEEGVSVKLDKSRFHGLPL